jgi:hypothetical protein
MRNKGGDKKNEGKNCNEQLHKFCFLADTINVIKHEWRGRSRRRHEKDAKFIGFT